MNNSQNNIKPFSRSDKLVTFFKKFKKNPKKKGELSEMILKDDFHNKNMSEEEYQKEQADWLKKVKAKKEKADWPETSRLNTQQKK